MPAGPAVTVRGLRELQAAFAHTDRQVRLGLRHELRDVAEPVRADAESFAADRIRNIGPFWGRMRVGITRTLVYVAPRQRGIRARGINPARRPNLAPLLMDRAMEPALERHAPELEANVEALLGQISADFNH